MSTSENVIQSELRSAHNIDPKWETNTGLQEWFAWVTNHLISMMAVGTETDRKQADEFRRKFIRTATPQRVAQCRLPFLARLLQHRLQDAIAPFDGSREILGILLTVVAYRLREVREVRRHHGTHGQERKKRTGLKKILDTVMAFLGYRPYEAPKYAEDNKVHSQEWKKLTETIRKARFMVQGIEYHEERTCLDSAVRAVTIAAAEEQLPETLAHIVREVVNVMDRVDDQHYVKDKSKPSSYQLIAQDLLECLMNIKCDEENYTPSPLLEKLGALTPVTDHHTL